MSDRSYNYTDNGLRAQALRRVRRVVLKVGTQLLRRPDTDRRISELVQLIAELRSRNLEVTLVSSGAVGIGMTVMNLPTRPKVMAKIQALSAIGQCRMMSIYEKACEAHGFNCAQLLLTAADLQDFERNRHVTQCISELLKNGILPIINENDSVCVDEIKVGDNDTLAAYVATMLQADLTILLTTIDGLHESFPDTPELGPRISTVTAIDTALMKMARGTDGNQYSVGGMLTKLHAASIVMAGGASMAILDGKDFNSVLSLLDGHDEGTLFTPSGKAHLHSQQRFLAFFSEPRGTIVVDDGAANALVENGRSLLPGGILGTQGVFHRGDAVRVINTQGQELARGIVNFAFDEIARICGAKTKDLPQLLGRPVETPEVIHRDHLVLVGF